MSTRAIDRRHGFLEQPIQLAIGAFQTHRRTVAGQFIDGRGDRLDRQFGLSRVSAAQRGTSTGSPLASRPSVALAPKASSIADSGGRRALRTIRRRVARPVDVRCRCGRSRQRNYPIRSSLSCHSDTRSWLAESPDKWSGSAPINARAASSSEKRSPDNCEVPARLPRLRPAATHGHRAIVVSFGLIF